MLLPRCIALTGASFLTGSGPSAPGARGAPLLTSGMSDASTAKLLGPVAPGTGNYGTGGGYNFDYSSSSPAAAPGPTSALTLGRGALGLRTYSPQPTLRGMLTAIFHSHEIGV